MFLRLAGHHLPPFSCYAGRGRIRTGVFCLLPNLPAQYKTDGNLIGSCRFCFMPSDLLNKNYLYNTVLSRLQTDNK